MPLISNIYINLMYLTIYTMDGIIQGLLWQSRSPKWRYQIPEFRHLQKNCFFMIAPFIFIECIFPIYIQYSR